MNGCLHQVTYSLLLALLRILHRRGVSFGEFSQIAKQAFVRVAEEDLEKTGERATTSRISVTTGLTRKDVAAIRKSPQAQHAASVNFNRSTRVITGWLTDTEFHDDKGQPAVLPKLGSQASFEALVARYSGDIPYRAMLQEMIRVGVATEDTDTVSLLTHGYLPLNDEEKLLIMGDDVSFMLNTIGHNLEVSSPQEARFQRKVEYDNLPEDILPEFKKMVSEDGMDLLIKFNDYLASHDRDANPQAQGTGKVKAGIGIYYFEESSNQDKKQ